MPFLSPNCFHPASWGRSNDGRFLNVSTGPKMEILPCIEMKRRKVAACEKDGSGRFPAKEANSDMIIQPDEEAKRALESWNI